MRPVTCPINPIPGHRRYEKRRYRQACTQIIRHPFLSVSQQIQENLDAGFDNQLSSRYQCGSTCPRRPRVFQPVLRTVASLLGELEDARVRATSLNQLGAVVKSISEKAKISGLLTTKIEITDNSGGTMDDWIDSMLYGPGSPGEQFRPFDQKDRQGLVDLVQRAASDIGEYLAALKARPIAAERVDLKKLPTDWQSLKPYSAVPVSVPRRIGNGRR